MSAVLDWMNTELQHTFPVERLKCSVPGVLDCGFRAFQNLYAWAGLEPPSLEDVYEFLRLRRERVGTDSLEEIQERGLRADETALLLEAFGFPSIVTLGTLPDRLTAREAFPVLQANGFGVLFNYTYRFEGRNYSHAVVLHSCEADHVEVLDCQPHQFYNWIPPAWEIEGEAAERLKDSARTALEAGWSEHGTITRLPYDTMDFTEQLNTPREAFDNGSEARAPLGINRWFVMVFPVDRKVVE